MCVTMTVITSAARAVAGMRTAQSRMTSPIIDPTGGPPWAAIKPRRQGLSVRLISALASRGARICRCECVTQLPRRARLTTPRRRQVSPRRCGIGVLLLPSSMWVHEAISSGCYRALSSDSGFITRPWAFGAAFYLSALHKHYFVPSKHRELTRSTGIPTAPRRRERMRASVSMEP